MPCFIRSESPPDRKVCPNEKRASVREGSNFYRTSAVTSILSEYTAGNLLYHVLIDADGYNSKIGLDKNFVYGQCTFAVPGSSRGVPLIPGYRSERTDKLSPRLNPSHLISKLNLRTNSTIDS